MAEKQVVPEQQEKQILSQIAEARSSRSRFAPTYNAFYDLAAPWKLRVDEKSSQAEPRSPTEQDDIFDSTLQEVTDDWASTLNDELTPSYRDWTKHQPVSAIPESGKRQVEGYIAQRRQLLYDTIRSSTFEEAAQEAYIDLAIGPCAAMIRYTAPGKPIDVEYVPLAHLLIAPGPFGGVGLRFWERHVKVSHLDVIWPDIDWSHIKPTRELREQAKESLLILEGGIRDYSASKETWNWYVISKNKVRFAKQYTGRGSCPLQVGRVMVSHPSAYGVNVGGKALAPARTLNELSYLNLKRLGKVVDPPGIFSDPTGTLNPEAGFEAGIWHEAGDGFSVQDLAPGGDMREMYFSREDLAMQVRRALYQDKPYQRGQTPPSASQWIGEEQMAAQRKTLYRARLHAEWVIAVIERFEWILQKRGQLQPLTVDDGEIIDIRPITPLSQASDLAEVQAADQLMTMFVAKFGEQALDEIDLGATLRSAKERVGDDVLKVRTPEEVQQIREQRAVANAMGAASGQT